MVGVFLADGFEELEAVSVITVLRRAGIEVLLISVSSKIQVTGARGIQMTADQLISEIKFSSFDMIVLPGGMPGASNLSKTPALMEGIKAFSKGGKWVAAICAAPAEVLGKAGLLAGHKATGYPGSEKNLVGAEVVNDKVVISEKFVTSKGPGTALDFAFALVTILRGEAVTKQVKEKMLV